MTDGVRRRRRCCGSAHVEVEVAGRRVLGPLDLTVVGGVPLMVTGPSGSGKSLLCLVLAGAVAPTRGRVTLDGREVHHGGATPSAWCCRTTVWSTA